MKNIFISSTFIDMQAERDLVQERVLPALREEARKYGDNVGVIDLRWGVDTSTLETEEGAAKVLKVCLDEIDRSHPYMLIFLGERYGTMMREDQIEKSVRGREDKYTTDDYVKSITALEVEYGALSEKYGELNHCVVCFREPVVHMLDGAEKDLYAEHTEEGKRKLEALMERIKQDLGEDDRLITYSCTWDKSARQLVDFTSNGQPLENVLTNCFVEMFRDDWKEYESLSWQDKEQLAFRALMESKLRSFVGREALLEGYYQNAINGTCPIILQGEVGSGKTAIMCKVVERLQKEGKNVFAFFSGAGSMSTTAESLVKQMVYYVENLLGVEEHFGEENTVYKTENISQTKENRIFYLDWIRRLGNLCSRLSEGEKIYFCIDALDQLFLDEHVENLDFFVKRINVQVIASCMDTFTLPEENAMRIEVKCIPALSEEDAKTVAEGILASYSRNAYVVIEEEILKKKSIGKPLYISLLIQRLNMMDIEELRQAMNEEEIVALGTGIIREMPEDTEEAMVAVIRNGIDKISEAEELLYEVLEYLAVSRNGLRISDLQGIFAMHGNALPILDLTLLMKYLDSFFYVQEDDRIDFTHKVIRQGLLKELTDREAKEEAIKEYLKTLDTEDSLRIREGMYFAQLWNDEDFAKELIKQAHDQKKGELVEVIIHEALKDDGKFYCCLIETEVEDDSKVCEFFLELILNIRATSEGIRVRAKIGETLIKHWRKIYEEVGSERSLINLACSYKNRGLTLQFLHPEGAAGYFDDMLRCREELFEKYRNKKNLDEVISVCKFVGDFHMRATGLQTEASLCYKKALEYQEARFEQYRNQENLDEVIFACIVMGNFHIKWTGYSDVGLGYNKKALKYQSEWYEKHKDDKNLKALFKCYDELVKALEYWNHSDEALKYCEEELQYMENSDMDPISYMRTVAQIFTNMGKIHEKNGQLNEALLFFEKAIKIEEDLYEKTGDEWELDALSSTFREMGRRMEKLSRSSEALRYYEEFIHCKEERYKKSENIFGLRTLISDYDDMNETCDRLGCLNEKRLYCEKSLKCKEKLYEKSDSIGDLRDLLISYNKIGNALKDLGQAREALSYYKKALGCAEELHEKSGSEESLRDLSIINNDMGNILCDLGCYKEALEYFAKNMRGREELYRLSKSDSNLSGLSVAYNNYGWILCELGRTGDAVEYLERALRYTEELHQKNPTKKTQLALVARWRNLARALQGANRLQEALEYGKKAVELDRELYSQDASDVAKGRVVKSFSIYAETLFADNQTEEAYKMYSEALEHCKSVCEKNDSIPNTRTYVKVLKGLYLCLFKMGQSAEAEEYLLLAKEEAKKLYERSGAEKDREILGDI